MTGIEETTFRVERNKPMITVPQPLRGTWLGITRPAKHMQTRIIKANDLMTQGHERDEETAAVLVLRSISMK